MSLAEVVHWSHAAPSNRFLTSRALSRAGGTGTPGMVRKRLQLHSGERRMKRDIDTPGTINLSSHGRAVFYPPLSPVYRFCISTPQFHS